MNEVPQEAISTRIPVPLAKKLDAQAESAGTTKGAYARELLIRGLSNSEDTDVDGQIQELRAEIAQLREDLATAVLALLVNGGKTSLEAAQQWVDEHFFAHM